ncbi:13623_t:CDS:2 [Entrophospora sp. SA101]|nr:13623_t:CDS:2 [Entrophospora sp. SA101]
MTGSEYKYSKNACVRCSAKHIKCDDKAACDNCLKVRNNCCRDKLLKKKIMKQQKLNRLYRRPQNDDNFISTKFE